MNPDPVKNDWELSTAIEKWEDKYLTITEDLQEEGLPDADRMAAVRRKLTGDIKRHVELESTKITTYQQLRSTIMKWAIGRKLERERKSDDMDIGAASGEQESNDDDSWNLACTTALEAQPTYHFSAIRTPVKRSQLILFRRFAPGSSPANLAFFSE